MSFTTSLEYRAQPHLAVVGGLVCSVISVVFRVSDGIAG